jgi:hypothetical protein
MKFKFSASGRCRLTMCLVVALLCSARPCSAVDPVASFDDIKFWVGDGANRSALVVDWHGTTTTDNSLAWGYRWDAPQKGIDMLTAIVTADPRLYVRMGPVSGFGTGVFGIGYDANNDGEFTIDDDTVTFDAAGIAISEPADGATSLDPEDWYAEGWFVGSFWNYGIATSSPFDGGSWARSGSGITNRNLADGSWDSLAFTPINTQNYAQNPIAAQPFGDADFDGDGDIDGRDFLAWQRGFGLTIGALPEQGDANGDGAVNAADLGFWSSQYGSEPLSALHLPPSALNSSIPEPSTGLLIPFVVLLTCCTRSKRKLVS